MVNNVGLSDVQCRSNEMNKKMVITAYVWGYILGGLAGMLATLYLTS